MTSVDRRNMLIGLHECPGLGWKRIEGILRKEKQWTEACHFQAGDWMECGLESELALRLADEFDEAWIETRLSLMERSGVQAITIFDPEYPVLMKETAKPPWVLYAIGDPELLNRVTIAMIGTRIPTAYGRRVAEDLTEALCNEGAVIVSGLARGIDGICHEAAIRCNGSTVAVLGTAIDTVYPSEHSGLYRMIAQRGLVLSEYPIGTKSHPGLFPQRNRIIAGISRGAVVVEADARSGSLITADQALEAGRDVFAVPGPITSPKSRGTLGLLKQGAKIVTEPSDILEEYEQELKGRGTKSRPLLTINELTNEERKIYHMLEQEDFTFDRLREQTMWEFGHLHSVLLSLIMKKAVVQLPGSVYKII